MFEKLEECPKCNIIFATQSEYDGQFCNGCGWGKAPENYSGMAVDGPVAGQVLTHTDTVIESIISAEKQRRVTYEYREFKYQGGKVAGFWTCEQKTHNDVMALLTDLAYASFGNPTEKRKIN